MTMTSRLYKGLEDFQQMRNLLIQNKNALPYSDYHVGDLNWWLFYDTTGSAHTEKVRLWEKEGQIVAWGWANFHRSDYDLVVHHALQGSPEESQIIDTMVNWLTEVTMSKPPQPDKPRQVAAYASKDEIRRIALLEAQDISADLPKPTLPEGFRFLDAMTPEYADERAAAHFDAFSPRSRMTGDYYRHLMTAPDYDPTLDIVTLAPDGKIAAYAMGWLDTANKISLYEPVGTRHEFHRQGLGKATLLEGLHRFKARGAKTALVSTWVEDHGNVTFYQAAGFTPINMIRTYTKTI